MSGTTLRRRLRRTYEGVRDLIQHASTRQRHHWLIAGGLITFGLYAGRWLEETDFPLQSRYRIYQVFGARAQQFSRSNSMVMVMIGDDEFWKRHRRDDPRELARRLPLNSYYIADLIKAIGPQSPYVIALDTKIRSQVPYTLRSQDPAYDDETDVLAKEIRNALNPDSNCHCQIVLPRTLIQDEEGGTIAEKDPLDRRLKQSGVRRGYILATRDIRNVPMPITDRLGERIPSFSSAVASAVNALTVTDAAHDARNALPYGRFHPPEFFLTVPANKVIDRDPNVLKLFSHKIVIIGAAWHRLAYGRGEQVDAHLTPVGVIPGALVHANYIEALLDRDTTGGISDAEAMVVDIALSTLAALVFVAVARAHRWRSLIGVIFAALVATLLMWHIFGLYFDFFIHITLLAAHVVIEQVLEWREDAREWRTRRESVIQEVA